MSNNITGSISSAVTVVGSIDAYAVAIGTVSSGVRVVNQGYNKADIDSMVNAKQDKLTVGQLANVNADHSKYLTQHQSLSAYALKSELPSVADLQEKLVAGDNITITGNIISAEAGGSAYDDTEIRQLISAKASSASLATVATSGNYNDLSNKPTQVTAFANDAGYLTQHQSLESYATKQWVENKNYLTNHQSLVEYAKKSELPTVPTNVSSFENDIGYLTQHQDISGKADTSSLSTVATSGSYNDLSDKPTIPAAVTDAHINDLIDAKLGVIENGSY